MFVAKLLIRLPWRKEKLRVSVFLGFPIRTGNINQIDHLRISLLLLTRGFGVFVELRNVDVCNQR